MEEPKYTKKAFKLSAEALGTDIVTLYVGPKRKTFAVHKKLLTKRSDYFAKAFTSGFQEAMENTMYLPEDNPDTVDMLVDYVYWNRLPSVPSKVSGADDARCDGYSCGCALYKLFYLAEKLCMNELGNKLMDKIQDFDLNFGAYPDWKHFRDIYENTHEGSKLRTYIVLMRLHDHATNGGKPDYENRFKPSIAELKTIPDFTAEFFEMQCRYAPKFQNIRRLADAQFRDDSVGFGRCFLHKHVKGEVCHLDDREPSI